MIMAQCEVKPTGACCTVGESAPAGAPLMWWRFRRCAERLDLSRAVRCLPAADVVDPGCCVCVEGRAENGTAFTDPTQDVWQLDGKRPDSAP